MQEEANEEEDRLDQEELLQADQDDNGDELLDIDLEKEAKFDEDVYIGSPEQLENFHDDLWKFGAKNWATLLTV